MDEKGGMDMIILFWLILGSIGIILVTEQYPTTRSIMQKLTKAYTPGICRSFVLDIIILLPLVGLLVELLSRRIKNIRAAALFPIVVSTILLAGGLLIHNAFLVFLCLLLYCPFLPGLLFGGNTLAWWIMRQTPFYYTALLIFLAISGSLYFDYLNFFFLTPFLGHPEAWSGNHFMWNSGIEVLGLRPFIDTAIPTYRNFWGFWNLFATFLFLVVYPLIMVVAGMRLHGLFFGYTEKQTGISALFFERGAR